MATTSDKRTKIREGAAFGFALAAAAVLYAGAFVCVNTSGYVVNASDATGLRFAGVAQRAVDNSGGAAGDETAELLVDGCVLVAGAGFDDGDIGQVVFLVDNETVGKASAVVYHIPVGRLVKVEDSATVWIRLEVAVPASVPLVFSIAGVDGSGTPAALDLATAGAAYGGTDLYVKSVQSVVSYTTSSGALNKLLAVTTDYTVANGDITIASNQSGKTLLVTALGRVVS